MVGTKAPNWGSFGGPDGVAFWLRASWLPKVRSRRPAGLRLPRSNRPGAAASCVAGFPLNKMAPGRTQISQPFFQRIQPGRQLLGKAWVEQRILGSRLHARLVGIPVGTLTWWHDLSPNGSTPLAVFFSFLRDSSEYTPSLVASGMFWGLPVSDESG